MGQDNLNVFPSLPSTLSAEVPSNPPIACDKRVSPKVTSIALHPRWKDLPQDKRLLFNLARVRRYPLSNYNCHGCSNDRRGLLDTCPFLLAVETAGVWQGGQWLEMLPSLTPLTQNALSYWRQAGVELTHVIVAWPTPMLTVKRTRFAWSALSFVQDDISHVFLYFSLRDWAMKRGSASGKVRRG